MVKPKVAFLEGRLSDWLDKNHVCFDHVNRLFAAFCYKIDNCNVSE